MNKNSLTIKKMALAAIFLVFGWILPLVTGRIPEIGNMLCPMHIPVMLCGFILGPWYGLIIGFITPLTRGFIFGMPIAYNLQKAFVPIRKKGKLPLETVEESYDLEYGSATIEMHKDSVKPGQKVVLVDDLIATGGTIEAAAKLVEELGGEVVKIIFLMELAGLKGRDKLAKYDVASVITYDGK